MLPIALDSSSTSYHVGEVAGLLAVLGLAVYVARRALTRGFGQPNSRAQSKSASFSGVLLDSVGGASTALRPATAGNERRPRQRDVLIALLAVAVAVAYVVSSLNRGILKSGGGDGWSSHRGLELKAGFVAGCSRSSPSRAAICECVFARISSTPPYDTPSGFEGLYASFEAFARTGDSALVPTAVLSSARSCAGA